MTELTRHVAAHPWFWGLVWQVTLAVACVWLAAVCLVRHPVWRAWLWRIALCKCAAALIIPFSLAIPVWHSPIVEAPQQVHQENIEKLVAERPAQPSAESVYDDASHRAVRPPVRRWTMAEVFTTLWLGGIALLVAIWLWQWLQLRSLLRAASPIDETFSFLIADVRQQVDVAREIEVLVTDQAVSPLVTGWRRPRILLPDWLTDAAQEAELRTALAHEFAHIRRRDLFWSLFAGGVGLIYFFHPFVWLALRRLRLTQESAADELVLRTTAITPADYAQTLLRVAESARATPRLHPALLAASRSYRDLSNRIATLQAPRRSFRWSAAIVLLVALIGLVPWHPVLSEPKAANSPAKKDEEEPKVTPLTQERILEIDAAIDRLRGKGVFVREFGPRGDSQYRVQIIAKKMTEDFSLQDVEIIARGVPLHLHLPKIRTAPEELKLLTTVKELQSLELSHADLDDAALAVLPELPLNGSLSLGDGSYTVDGMKYVAACKNLTSISLEGVHVTDEFLESLVEMPNLGELALRSPNFTSKAFEIQLRLQNLKSLRLPRNPRSSDLVLQPADIARLTKLQIIDLSGPQYDDATARALADHCPQLEQVYLRGTAITNRGVEELTRLTKLTTLTLDGAPLNDGVADAIRQMKQLQWLSLNQCPIGDETFAAACECSDLWTISAGHTKVTDAGVKHVLELPKLSYLVLWSNKRVTDDSLDVFKRLPNEEDRHFTLQLQFTSISEDGMRDLQATLKHATVVSSFPSE